MSTEPLLAPDGTPTTHGRTVFRAVFELFDVDSDGTWDLEELNRLTALAGAEPQPAESWSLLLEAMGVVFDAAGKVPRDECDKYLAWTLRLDPERLMGLFDDLGLEIAPEAWPKVSAEDRDALKARLSDRIAEVVSTRAAQTAHDGTIIAAYPTGSLDGDRCTHCGATKSGFNCPQCGRW
jgi:hypothetical protein